MHCLLFLFFVIRFLQNSFIVLAKVNYKLVGVRKHNWRVCLCKSNVNSCITVLAGVTKLDNAIVSITVECSFIYLADLTLCKLHQLFMLLGFRIHKVWICFYCTLLIFFNKLPFLAVKHFNTKQNTSCCNSSFIWDVHCAWWDLTPARAFTLISLFALLWIPLDVLPICSVRFLFHPLHNYFKPN